MLTTWLNHRLENPGPGGHRCDFCTRGARYAIRLRTSKPAWWQLLTSRVHYCCGQPAHWRAAAAAAARAVAR